MAIDGVYGFVYCGANGIGFGVFTVKKGSVEGCDPLFRYHGTATELPDGSIDMDVSFVVPAGAEMVQGVAAQDTPHTRFIKQRLPAMFGDGAPQQITSGPGGVTVMFKRVPDEWEPYTKGFSLAMTPLQNRAG